MPVNALSAGETYTEQQTLDDLNTENSNSTNESNATSAEVATDSNASEEASISDISSNDIEADALERMLSSEEKLNNEISLQSDNTEDDGEEPSTDNWELGLVFYDSTVDNGKTPLTSIDWDASDGGYGKTDSRIITVQINYKNTNAVTTYKPGELEISIPNLIYGTGYTTGSSANWLSSVTIGANDSTHTGYDWNFSGYSGDSTYKFTNAVIIEEKSNFEGSIQIVYNIEPIPENSCHGSAGSQSNRPTPNYPIEHGKDSCLHTKEQTLKATLKDILESNEIYFKYRREYIHPWEEASYSIAKSASKVSSYDGLGENPQDYYWVKFTFTESPATADAYDYPKLYALNRYFKEVFPEGSVCYNSSLKEILPNENNEYIITDNINRGNGSCQIIVGYPKSFYSEDDLSITNRVELYGTYYTREEEKLLAEAACNINLADFEFQYTGELYSIGKRRTWSSKNMYYQNIIKNGEWEQWHLFPETRYTGRALTVKIGDDMLFATNKDGEQEKLTDDEYYFSRISWEPFYLRNGNNIQIAGEKYDCELWVRYANTPEYILHEAFKNPSSSIAWSFEQNKVVGFYFIIHDMQESIIEYKTSSASWDGFIKPTTYFIKKEIPQNGTLYNFCYLQTYFKDGEGNLVLQNEPELSSYSNFMTQLKVGSLDKETYGTYMQRNVASREWAYHYVNQLSSYISAYKTNPYQITQDAANERFLGSFDIGATLQGNWDIEKEFWDDYEASYAIKGYKVYDLLPEGMEINSTKEEIAKSLKIKNNSYSTKNAYDIEGNTISNNELLCNTESNVNITENWNDTGRTKIEIIATFKKPIYFTGGYPFQAAGNNYNYDKYFYYTYNYAISYDSFLEYGNIWLNDCFVEKLDGQEYFLMKNAKIDELDINENGETENMGYAKATATITSVVSTHQDVTKYVQTDKSNFSTGRVDSSCDSEYIYKLRVRTGQNDVTNLVIYDSIEQYVQNPYSQNQDFITAYGKKKYWNGEFLGVDTSYAEKKGYKIKVWYSEDVKAGNLSEDNSWKEYSDSVDKSKVKSLAFEYLNKNDESLRAILPANSQTYVLIKMKSPADESITTLAYNGCRTEWNALDDYDRPVDFVTGINSNIVKVALPNSKDDDPIINLSFVKSIDGTEEVFEKLQLKKDNIYRFQIVLTNQDTGDIIKGILNSKTGLKINEIPIGTYLIKESDDMYFDFVDMTAGIADGIIFEKTDNGYLLTIDETISEDTTFEITVNNKIEPDKPYEDKKEKTNLFKFFS